VLVSAQVLVLVLVLALGRGLGWVLSARGGEQVLRGRGCLPPGRLPGTQTRRSSCAPEACKGAGMPWVRRSQEGCVRGLPGREAVGSAVVSRFSGWCSARPGPFLRWRPPPASLWSSVALKELWQRRKPSLERRQLLLRQQHRHEGRGVPGEAAPGKPEAKMHPLSVREQSPPVHSQ